MTDAEVDRVIEDARRANTELHIRDHNGKVIQNYYQNPKRGEEDKIEKITLREKPQKKIYLAISAQALKYNKIHKNITYADKNV